MDNDAKELKRIFNIANKNFLIKNSLLLDSNVSERTLCGALMIELKKCIERSKYKYYFVDVEYNRNVKGTIKMCKKTVLGPLDELVTINCDLIVHSRGINTESDNLIALEMKKSNASKKNKEKDRNRLKSLTSFEDVYSGDGTLNPQYVCGYKLGIYYELNLKTGKGVIEYYYAGEFVNKENFMIQTT